MQNTNPMHTPEIRNYVKEVTLELLESYGKILNKMPALKVSSGVICDINISIVASFMSNILYALEGHFKDKLGDEISPRKVMQTIYDSMNERFNLN